MTDERQLNRHKQAQNCVLSASAIGERCYWGFVATAALDGFGQANGAATSPALADQTQEAALDRVVLLVANLLLRCPAQRLPCRLVADRAAISGKNLQQQVAQLLVVGLAGDKGR